MPDCDDCPNQPELLEEIELISTSEGKHTVGWRHLRDMARSLAAPAEHNLVELRIGLYWLHKVGFVCLVCGLAFLILCSFWSFVRN
jgi:hypothetical protein